MAEFFTLFPLFFATICGGICIFFILQLIIGLFVESLWTLAYREFVRKAI